ncbi:hypothetical protein DAMA08_051230 [Martiniozyma asiatica (nom. inval.)]|nr:hypothetical protein DAMA08_051230 [Martiniozyma asiatica]
MKYSVLALLATALRSVSAVTERTYSNLEPSTSDIAKAAATASTTQWTSDVKGKAFDRFVVIWLENTNFDQAAEEPHMAWLAEQGITLTNYWALTHPSEPNYMASVGGDYFSLDDDRFVYLPKNVSTVVDLLDDKGISWATYQEHLPYTGFQGYNYSNQETFANDYMRKHNPLIFYDSVTSNDTRLSLVKNFTMFEKDLADEKLPQYVIITPNMTNDAHDSNIKVAGNWAKNFLTPLLENEYFMDNTLVLLTFDENETYGDQNTVFSLLLGGAIPDELKGTTDNTFYDHYSQIASAEVNWDLYNLGRNDVTANIWQSVANATDIENAVVDTSNLLNNHTYIGYFYDDQIELPAPNVDATNIAGKGVLPAISSAWASEYKEQVSAGYFTSTTTVVSHEGTFTNLASVFEAATASNGGSSTASSIASSTITTKVTSSASASASKSSSVASPSSSKAMANGIAPAAGMSVVALVAALFM